MALRADDVDLGRDRELVVRSQSGDDHAFEDLYRRYFDRLYRFCLRRVGDPHEAEELAQETFARAYRALPRLTGDRRFYPWLSVIASRLCVDEYRRRSRSEPTAVVDLGVGEGGQERVIQALDAALLNRAISRLTPRHQDVLRLREHEGWSYQHIADHMGVNLGTIEALLHRARRALKREFDVLAGPEALPAAVGGGVLAGLRRRLQSLRAKVTGCDEAWVPVLGNAVLAAVLVVGTTIGGGGASAEASDKELSMAPVAAVSRMIGEASGTWSAASSTPGPATGPGSSLPSRSGRAFRPGEDVGPGGVLLHDDDERAKDQPTVVDINVPGSDEGVTVGADAGTTTAEATQRLDHWARRLAEEAP